MGLAVSDELLGTFVPIVVYWIYSGIYMAFGTSSSFENYRLHSKKDEEEKNLVSKYKVIKNVLFQQSIQAFFAIFLYSMIGNNAAAASKSDSSSSIFVIARQFIIAMLVLDTWQYFMHRYFHLNKFLYRHFHSRHHKLVVPYAFGAIYNHPLEGFAFDIIGGALAYFVSAMSPRTSIFFFSFATMKSVDDHCGLWLPGNLFHIFFSNNSAYHDVHHYFYGGKFNFSQPFFVMWDRIMGTYMPFSLEKKYEDGFEVRPIKRPKE